MSQRASFDPEAFRQFEHEGWNSLHEGYHRYWEHLTTQAIARMLEGAGVAAGMHVLDIACGPGYVSKAAAGCGAMTIGIDLSENMVDLASANQPGLVFWLADAEDLPFDAASFDAVLINFGILHFPDADRALEEAARVLRPGGRIAFTDWAHAEGSAIEIALRAIAKEGTLRVDLPRGTPLYRFADHEDCRRSLEVAGFCDVACRDLLLTWTLPAPGALMETFRQATARTAGLLNAQAPVALPRIAAAMAAECRRFEKDGQVDLPMPAVLTTATRT